jgi:hypothetical protein
MPFGRRPDFEGDLGAILTDYLTNSAKETRIPGYEAERAVESWLKTLVDAVQPPDNPQLKWLADSGLFDRIKNGVVQREALRRTITHA